MERTEGLFRMRNVMSISMAGLMLLSSLMVIGFIGASGEGGGAEPADQPAGAITRLSGTRSLRNEPANQRFTGAVNYDYLGSGLCSGDVNGDGATDIVIGARGASSYMGCIYVFFGMTNTASELDTSKADVVISNPGGGNYFGETIGVGDVDGDGIDDIISGNYYASSYRGEAYIHFGSRSWGKGVTISSPDVKFIGESSSTSSNYFGMDVWCDDLDGDNVDDVIVVEPGYYQSYVQERWKGYSYYIYNYTGLCFLYFGRTRTEWGTKGVTYDMNSGIPANSVRIKGWTPRYSSNYRYSRLGYSSGQAIGTGNFNNDAYKDLVVGSYYSYGGSYSYSGSTWLIFGMSRSSWLQWGGHYDMLARQGEYIYLTMAQSSAYTGFNPRLGDVNGDKCDDLVTCSYYGTGSYQGKMWVVFGTNDTARLNTLKKTMQGTWPMGGYYNFLNTVANFTILGPSSSTYMAQVWLADFDGDQKDDLLLGAGYETVGSDYSAGKVYLMYGRTTAEWQSKYEYNTGDAAWAAEGEGYYNYLGYYSMQSLCSGDFNGDKVDDILMSAYGWGYQKSQYYRGAVYMIMTAPPKVEIGTFELTDGDGPDGRTVLPETGGADKDMKTEILTGDGVYTFKGNLTDSWTLNEIEELRMVFTLRGPEIGVEYRFGYGIMNKTFYTIANPASGVELVKDQSNFKYLNYQSGVVNFSVVFHLPFLNQEQFDVTFQVVRKSGIIELRQERMLRLEKDLVIEGTDFLVTRDGEQVFRGDYLATGGPLIVTGMRIVHPGTIVSPANDKFFIRVFDSYSRIFEDRNSSGRQLMIEIPTQIDSGIYKFSMDVILSEEAAPYMTVAAVVPSFYLQLDFNGPERPSNVRFHADGLEDPEGRWDDDLKVWASWDPSFDTQQSVVGYHVEINGPAYRQEYFTEELSMEFDLPEPGTYVVFIRGEDESSNIGPPGGSSIIVDMSNITLLNPYPDYHGGIWFKAEEMEVQVTLDDFVPSSSGPSIDLSTLEYALTQELSLNARDLAGWKAPKTYRVVDVRRETDSHVLTTVSVPVEVSEGKGNYIWFRVSDAAGNSGMTTYINVAERVQAYRDYAASQTSWDEVTKARYVSEMTVSVQNEANRTNPSNIWVDITSIVFEKNTPSSEPLDENLVMASILVRDLEGSGVDASTVQYSVSRNGIGNYGGWTTIEDAKDGESVEATTVSPLLFEPGSVNYIRWRAKDIAGNGFKVSDDLMIVIKARPVNSPPMALITSPEMNKVFTTLEKEVFFDGSSSSDPDQDNLTYEWVLANKTVLSRESQFKNGTAYLKPGVHVITLYVSDGRFTVTDSISIYIRKDPSEVDTDKDGIVDGSDPDDDDDLLDDTVESELGTNPRLVDTDLDGVNDNLDAEPLNPEVTSEAEEREYSYWEVLLLVILLSVLIIGIGAMVVLNRRSTMEKRRIMRAVAQEGRIVSRYEALTGIEAPLLPQVKEMGLTLPPVAAQQVAPIRRAQKLGETPSLPQTRTAPVSEPRATPAPEPKVEAKSIPVPAPAPAPEPRPVPPSKEPAPRRRARRRGEEEPGAAPGEVPSAEKLMSTPSLPGEKAKTASTATCDLCGSSITVPEGATTVECPLCGEKKVI